MADLTNDEKIEALRRMLRIRYFDEAAAKLQAQGLIPGPLHTTIGQEAEVVGTCMALNEDDYNVGNHRSHGHPIGKGAALGPLMAELMGRATGVCKGHGGSMHLADFSVGSLGESGIVGAGMPIANGAALSAKLRGTSQVSLAFFGDGGANTGPFHESLNLASIWKLPMIFLCENNGYAVSSSARDMMAIEHVADRAAGYGVPGVIVDGQDVLATHAAVAEAVARARSGEGPSLLDVKTYRYHNHSEFGGMEDNLNPYRTVEEIDEWKKRDPIELFEAVLVEQGVLDQEAVKQVEVDIDLEVQEAVTFAKESPFPDLSSAYEYLYSNPIPIAQ